MKKKILVVDDNQIMLSFLSNLLEREGHQVVVAKDGFSALDILTSFTPDVMFIDLIMPKIGGDKLCQIVRKMQYLNDCFIVILSAAVAEMDFEYTKIGADTCIAKGPFSSMATNVLTAVKESDSPERKQSFPKPIMGIDRIYARQMTKELLSRNRHLETILESIAEGILEVYSDKIVYANSAAISLFGVPQEKILAAYPPDLFDKRVRPRVEALLKSGPGESFEVSSNTPIELNNRLVSIRNLPVKGEEVTTIMLMRDITGRRGLELQLRHAQKMEAVGTIASGVAHNFRNTLAAISVNCQVIQMDYKDDAKLNELINRINTSVERGVHLVDGLMRFARKQRSTEFNRVNLSTVIKDISQIIKKTFDEKIKICLDIPEPLPIIGNRAELYQAMMNLCTNARDAMPEGGELRIKGMPEGNMAMVVVSDTGMGMDNETKEKCFDPFFTTKEVDKGTGLGLSTTYGIVKSHGGKIDVDSIVGKGTTFKLYFPWPVLRRSREKEKMNVQHRTSNIER